MTLLRALLARIAGLFGSGHSDAEVADELATHLEMATAENLRRGRIDPVIAMRAQ